MQQPHEQCRYCYGTDIDDLELQIITLTRERDEAVGLLDWYVRRYDLFGNDTCGVSYCGVERVCGPCQDKANEASAFLARLRAGQEQQTPAREGGE